MDIGEKEIFDASVPYEHVCGVYILIHQDRIVYVGQSKSVLNRIGVHGANKKRPFDRYTIIKCDPANLSDLEAELIVRFAPAYNVCMPPNSKWMTIFQIRDINQANIRDLRMEIKNQNIPDTNGYYLKEHVTHLLRIGA